MHLKIYLHHCISYAYRIVPGCFLLVFSFNTLAYDAKDELYECFDIIFGKIITDSLTNSTWYHKATLYSVFPPSFNSLPGASNGGLPDFSNCSIGKLERIQINAKAKIDQSPMFLDIAKPHIETTTQYTNISEGSDISKYPIIFQHKEVRQNYFYQISRNNNSGKTNYKVDPNSLNVSTTENILLSNTTSTWNTSRPNFLSPSATVLSSKKSTAKGKLHTYISGSAFNSVKLTIQNQIHLTSNSCWLIRPDSFGTKNGKTLIVDTRKFLFIDSLYHDTQNNLLSANHYCSQPVFKNRRTSTPYITPLPESPPENVATTFRVQDFLDRDNKELDSPNIVGFDYDAYSPSPGKLLLIHQKGFEHNSTSEKELNGDLILSIYERFGLNIETAIVTNIRSINLTKKCPPTYLNWVSLPKFSFDHNVVYFLGTSKPGDDSSRKNLFSVKLVDVLSKSYNCEKHIKKLTNENESQFPIYSFSLSDRDRLLTLLREREGKSDLLFFKMNPVSGTIKKKLRYTFEDIGFIHDIAKISPHNNFTNKALFYTISSDLDRPTDIRLCFLITLKVICNRTPIDKSYSFADKQSLFELGSSQNNVTKLQSIKIPSSFDRPAIDTHILKPEKPNGDFILSIHGGPNESWNGQFHIREYLLAKLGFTVLLPNPTGSTGYGDSYTTDSRLNWGSLIYQDIVDLLEYSSKIKGNGRLIVLGFSFGGYMINWLHSRPTTEVVGAEKTRVISKATLLADVDAFIQMSPAYDLREFAASTDQLWFPEHQLGCSGSQCRPEKCSGANCIGLKACDIDHNPKCFENELTNSPRIPTLITVGENDQRIPLCSNLKSQLIDFRTNLIPYRNLVYPQNYHGLNIRSEIRNIKNVFIWLHKLKELPKPIDLVSLCRQGASETDKELFDNCKDIPISILSCQSKF